MDVFSQLEAENLALSAKVDELVAQLRTFDPKPAEFLRVLVKEVVRKHQ